MKTLIRLTMLLVPVAAVSVFNWVFSPGFGPWYPIYLAWCLGSGAVAGILGANMGDDLVRRWERNNEPR